MKTILGILIAIILVGGVVYYVDYRASSVPSNSVATSTSNAGGSSAAPNTTNTTAATPESGLGSQAGSADIIIDNPRIGDTITSPVSLSGKARGSWFFEGTAPVVLEDASGTPLASGQIKATGDWMTTNFVPFTGSLSWNGKASTSAALLVFTNDNPSGNPATEERVTIQVYPN